MKKEDAYLLLSYMTVFTAQRLHQYLDASGGPEEFLQSEPEDFFPLNLMMTLREMQCFREVRDEYFLSRIHEELAKENVHYYSMEHPLYPASLLHVPAPPVGVFVKGKLPPEDQKHVAIIGARKASSYGKEMAFFFSEKLSRKNIALVSGMALGIDGFAGRGALKGTGGSYAVLGGGVSMCYPIENMDLYRNLTGIISERPPHYIGHPFDFPLRNRIISGLCDVLIVIEAAENSGSLITVNYALNEGKTVFALPGRVGDRMSAGCNRLIRDGAEILTCPEDVLQYLGFKTGKDEIHRSKVLLSKEENIVFENIEKSPRRIDDIIHSTGLPVSVLNEILIRLEIKGLIKREPFGGYLRT